MIASTTNALRSLPQTAPTKEFLIGDVPAITLKQSTEEFDISQGITVDEADEIFMPLTPRLLVVIASSFARWRGTRLTLLAVALHGYGAIGQQLWDAWRRKQRLAAQFSDIITAVVGFADPPITSTAAAQA